MSYVAGFIAAKFRNEFPHLGLKTSDACPFQPTNYPWLSALSRGGLTQPSTEFFDQVKKFENEFQSFHGSSISKECNIVKNFQNLLLKKFPNLNPKVALKYSRTRTFIRMKFLNHELRSKSNALKRREAKKKCQFSQSH
jgi:hypothetical protein